MSTFCPVGVVAFAGSRSGSPFGVSAAVSAVVGLGLSVSVGCQSGVDSVVRAAVPSATVFRASAPEWSSLSVAARFAARTRACVLSASCLLVFPLSSGVLGVGSALAVRVAVSRHLPVFVAGPVCPVGVAGAFWSASSFAGISGWSSSPVQPSLF